LYQANLTGGVHSEGLFRHDGTTATTIALQNSAAPGTTATFFSDVAEGDSASMNDAGIVLFAARIVGAGVTEANNYGYWFGTDAGDLQLLVREGDTIFVNGANRTVASVYEQSVSEAGVVWNAWFADNTTAIIYTTFAALPGDFNEDGAVDAADYVVWRKGLGDGTYTQDDYNTWRANFGAPADGAAAGVRSPLPFAVPEPATSVMMLLTAAGCLLTGGRAAGKPR
jgi:hypothetical protein